MILILKEWVILYGNESVVKTRTDSDGLQIDMLILFDYCEIILSGRPTIDTNQKRFV